MHNRLWAPWRHEYIASSTAGKERKCVFCVPGDRRRDHELHILTRSRHSFAMLNRYPYNAGHVLIAPYLHTADFGALRNEVLTDMMKLAQRTQKALSAALSPAGYNIGLNLGRTAGAGFEDHLHLHIVPRWNGDTNFFPVTAGTRVISRSLESIYALLVKKGLRTPGRPKGTATRKRVTHAQAS